MSPAALLSLEGRLALVTGGSRGISRAIAARLEDAGAHVCIADIAPPPAGDSRSGRWRFVACDVASEASVRETIATIEADAPIDVLVNNAGIAEPTRATSAQNLADWQAVIDVNLKGAFIAAREAGARMLERCSGAIVNIGSIVGLAGFRASSAYGISKAALAMLTRTLASERAGRGVRVNCVAPGIIEAPMASDVVGEGAQRAAVIARIPARRLGRPDDVANAVLFLASNPAAYVTGVVLPVDGGWTAFGGPAQPHPQGATAP